ncbi:hypothetical protein CERSUDRAFT_137817 [Gelatoporia subvermispora B]|uniref:VHS domain-containing protein n=1 Tax=Ceriporiopsis subvermispora (strain B) TaxID=914234 RepID=M2QGL8_CERS8|nr:hypothetical protein CERSUDRAFT_137817 [Gelatoporia subvermispora B]
MFANQQPWSSNVKPLDVLIVRACNPAMPEPNYALHLEVAEYVNKKKANTPREAAMLIARLVNHRNPHIAMLALALLETLVQSCGYAFHLQIATKEFLNELVRRFPERPPPFPNPVMSRILELIHHWKETICVESKWKEDLGNIRDMHRLLMFKGYRFRDMARPPAPPSVSNLKTAEELEAEDREAQEAKLQELIRRGTPRDLEAAQQLMKSLAGANPEAKPDYRTQALNELNKLENQVILLNQLLDNVDTSKPEKFVEGDAYDQVAKILMAARPKIQGWISNAETEDTESLDTFLQINDQINTVVERYEAFKKGDYAAASNPIPLELGGGAKNDLSLIDFDDSAPSTSNGSTSGGAVSSSGVDELFSLFAPSTNPGPSQPTTQPVGLGSMHAPSMGSFQTQPTGGSSFFSSTYSSPAQTQSTTPGYPSGTISPASLNSAPRHGAVSPSQGPIRLGTPHIQGAISPQPATQSLFAGGSAQQPMQPQYGAQQLHPQYTSQHQQPQMQAQWAPQQPVQVQVTQPQQQPQGQRPAASAGQAQGKDPFADLVGLF